METRLDKSRKGSSLSLLQKFSILSLIAMIILAVLLDLFLSFQIKGPNAQEAQRQFWPIIGIGFIILYFSLFFIVKGASNTILKQNDDLVRKNVDLESANKEITKALEAKTEFLNRAAHDLRTPLVPIVTLLPIVQKRTKNKKDKYDIGIINNNAKYLNNIVEEVLDIVRTGSNEYKYNFENLELKNLISEVVANNKVVFQNSKINAIDKVPADLPMVYADRHKMIEVLQNVISNAIKFSQKGSTITFSAKKMNNFINLRITDTGIGMTKETISKLFTEFFKADESRHYKGSGLGLSICKKIMEGNHGNISAESEGLGRGSTIVINIPIK